MFPNMPLTSFVQMVQLFAEQNGHQKLVKLYTPQIATLKTVYPNK